MLVMFPMLSGIRLTQHNHYHIETKRMFRLPVSSLLDMISFVNSLKFPMLTGMRPAQQMHTYTLECIQWATLMFRLPVSLLLFNLSSVILVKFPMQSGISPAQHIHYNVLNGLH